MKKEKTVDLVLTSPLCEDRVPVPADLWKEFKKVAKRLKMTPEELFPIVLRHYLLEGAEPK